ncbi:MULTISPECIES: Fe(3+)-hydroxamate ABC transporter substrate-binding protein FhuD [unclassified Sinorhizobium]|uniref:Fe(3+)-hydroxamate ABC transporter substrate-binding protein FhuD n=1 Tax=unclassified Sinorhizobium TaxID=2613772 RepID=UPI003525D615
MRHLRRRDLLKFVPAVLTAGMRPRSAFGGNPPDRIAALEWASAETLIALKAPPIGLADVEGYRRWVVEPAPPPDVVDLGLRTEPNLELLQWLAPDLITMVPGYSADRARLERIAPSMSLEIYTEQRAPFEAARRETLRLAQTLGRTDEAEMVIREAAEAIEAARSRLKASRIQPIYLINLIDPRHVSVFGRNSMFDDVLRLLGLRNAWTGKTNFWGWATGVGLENLTASDARLVYFRPRSRLIEDELAQNRLWNSLPFAKTGRITRVEPVWYFGGLVAAARFARLLTDALLEEGRRA